MAQQKSPRSAAMTWKLRAFCGIFVVLCAAFEPVTAYALALSATTLLSQD